jgi:pyruvate dehydrogenase (quinone)
MGDGDAVLRFAKQRQYRAFTGDGSATMIMGELATLAWQRLPVRVVVMKNNTLELIK